MIATAVHVYAARFHWQYCKKNLIYHFLLSDSMMCRSLSTVTQLSEVFVGRVINGYIAA
jgi:hypothetical protein